MDFIVLFYSNYPYFQWFELYIYYKIREKYLKNKKLRAKTAPPIAKLKFMWYNGLVKMVQLKWLQFLGSFEKTAYPRRERSAHLWYKNIEYEKKAEDSIRGCICFFGK